MALYVGVIISGIRWPWMSLMIMQPAITVA
jgi:hypothetical protein